MKQHLSHICALCLFFCSFAHGKPLNPNRAVSIDLSQKGFLIVSCDEIPHELSIPPVWIKYFISKTNQRKYEGEFESKEGEIYVFALDPGEYQIRDWKLSGKLSGDKSWWSHVTADNPYNFHIEAGRAIYIGRILTDVNYHKEPTHPTNRPIILDRYELDTRIISSKYKTFQKIKIENSTTEGFNWLNSGEKEAENKSFQTTPASASR